MKAKPNIKDRFVIIMAGGRGERFWPVSRQATPKQLITLLGKRSFLQQAVDRVLPVVPLKNIIIITNAAQAAWDPREAGDGYAYAGLAPERIQAWREANEIAGRTLMRQGRWLV